MKYDYLDAAAAMDDEIAEFIENDNREAIKEVRQHAADNPKTTMMVVPLFMHS